MMARATPRRYAARMNAQSPTSSIMLFAICACVVGGMLTALQGPTNAMMAKPLNSAVNAAFVSFAVGTLVLLIGILAMRIKPDWAGVRDLPWYAWLGGAYGAVFVCAAAFSAPRLGVASTITLMIAGQLLAGILVDHFGGFGIAPRPVNLTRLLGVAMVFGGVIIVRKF
jgi:transporter family-2 protein